MVWRYCIDRFCGRPMDEPTIRQVADGTYCCPACDAPNDPLRTLGEILEDFDERLKSLERIMNSDGK